MTARLSGWDRWGWLALLLILPPLGLVYLHVYPSPDQALFDYLAWMNISGRPFYAEGFEQNWPGALLLHDLATRLFGVRSWSFRLLDYLIMAAALAAVTLHLLRGNHRIAGWTFAFTYPLLYATSGRWMAGERDVVAIHLLLIAAILLLLADHRLSRARDDAAAVKAARPPGALHSAAGAGALVAGAMLIRPTYLLFAALAGLLLLDAARREKRIAATLRGIALPGAAGFLVVVASVLLAGLSAGTIDDWYEQTILFNVQAYQVTETRGRLAFTLAETLRAFWPWLTPIAALGLAAALYARAFGPELRLIGALLLTILISYVVQNKGFAYHLGGLIPLMLLLAAFGLEAAIRIARAASGGTRAAAIAAGAATGLLLAAGLASRLAGIPAILAASGQGEAAERRAIVAILRCETLPSDRLFQWGRESDLLYRAERLPVSRFVSTPALALMSGPLGELWLAEFARDFRSGRPRMIVVDPADLAAGRDGAPSQAVQFIRGELDRHYRLRHQGARLELFVRKDVPPVRICDRAGRLQSAVSAAS